MARTILASLVALAALSGCSAGSSEPSSTEGAATPTDVAQSATTAPVEGEGLDLPTWDGSTPAVFTCTSEDTEGIVYTITLPTDEANPMITSLEALRAEVGVSEQPGYLLLEVDATKSTTTSPTGAYMVQWATLDQATQEADPAYEQVGDWMDIVSTDNTDLYNRLVDAYNEVLDNAPARGAKGTDLFATTGPIASMVGPIVMKDAATVVPCELAS